VLDNFVGKNAPVLWAHDYKGKPIGKCTDIQVKEDGILATVEFTPKGLNPEADMIYEMYKQAFLNAWSIGFQPIEYEQNEAGGYDFKSWELFEFSSVPVPDNPRALTIMRSKGIDVDNAFENMKGKELPSDFVLEKKEEKSKEEKPAEKAGEKPTEAKATETPKSEEKQETTPKAEEKKEPAKTEAKAASDDNEQEPYTDETKVTALTVGDLKDILEDALEDEDAGDTDDAGKQVATTQTKDVGEVTALAYILDELSYFIYWFTESEVSQSSIDKLNQALVLVMDVVKEQAEIGKKEIAIPPLQFTKDGKLIFIKEGRTLSADTRTVMQGSMEHIKQAHAMLDDHMKAADNAGQAPSNAEDENVNTNTIIPAKDDGKSVTTESFLQKLSNSLLDNNLKQNAITKNQNLTLKKQQAIEERQKLTLNLLKELLGAEGGEK
jgi:HK97 family phage prohead protease